MTPEMFNNVVDFLNDLAKEFEIQKQVKASA